MGIFAAATAVVGAHTISGQTGSPSTMTVCGAVQTVSCDEKGSRFTTVALKPKSKVPITILPADRSRFPRSPEELYRDTQICATGVVDTRNRHRLLVVSGPDDIVIRRKLKSLPPHRTIGYFLPCDEGVEIPTLVGEVSPSYTRSAMEARIQGVVKLEAIVTVEGLVDDIIVLRSLDSELGLDDEAIKAVRQWRFKPGTRMGEPVPVLSLFEISFHLR